MHILSNNLHNHFGLVFLMNVIIISQFNIYQHYRIIASIDEGLHLYPDIICYNQTGSQPLFAIEKKESQKHL